MMFLQTSTQLGYLNMAALAMFLFGPGQLNPLPQTSPGPASTCVVAPPAFHDRVAPLRHVFLAVLLVSWYLGSHARRVVAAKDTEGGLNAMDARTKLKLRMYMLVAVAFSAVAVGIAVSYYTYVLQINYRVFSCICMSKGVRVVVFTVDAIVAMAGIYTYGHMLRAVLFAD